MGKRSSRVSGETTSSILCTPSDFLITMKLYHYSSESLSEPLRACPEQSFGPKPVGLWVSVDDAWEQWCKESGFHPERLKHRMEIKLARGHNVLITSNPRDLSKFNAGAEYFAGIELGSSSLLREYALDWGAIAKKWDGVIIAPYCWKERLNLLWYYGWDCASGCIWNPLAISKIEQAPERVGTLP